MRQPSRGRIPRAPHCQALFTVYEMKRLGRDAAGLTAPADHLTARGLVLEMLAGPLPGVYDPTGPGKLLFAFFAAMAETERENIREPTPEGLDTTTRPRPTGGPGHDNETKAGQGRPDSAARAAPCASAP